MSDDQKQTAQALEKKLQQRPDKEELVQKNVMKGTGRLHCSWPCHH